MSEPAGSFHFWHPDVVVDQRRRDQLQAISTEQCRFYRKAFFCLSVASQGSGVDCTYSHRHVEMAYLGRFATTSVSDSKAPQAQSAPSRPQAPASARIWVLVGEECYFPLV